MTKSQLIDLFKFYNPDIKVGTKPNAKITESQLLIILNNGALDIARLTQCIKNTRSLSAVQYQYKYTLNTNILGIEDEGGVWFWESTSGSQLECKTLEYWNTYYPNWYDASCSTPLEFTVRGNDLYLRPAPDTGAYTTTLDGGIGADDTTLTLSDGTNFPKRFRCLIDDEVIEVQRHSDNECYSLLRGLEGTTAASHSDGATVTMRNILLFTFEKPQAMSDDSDDPFNGLTYLEPYHEGILLYARWKIKPIIDKKYDAKKGEQEYYDFIALMKRELNKLLPIKPSKLQMRSYGEFFKTAF